MKIGIVAHTDRLDMANHLADDVDARFVSLDNGDKGCLGNHRHVWYRIAGMVADDEWAIVLEDDAVPVGDFRGQLTAALAVAPAGVVSLYLGKLRPPQWANRVAQAVSKAELQHAHWITADYMLHAVGIAIRGGELADKMLHATKTFRRPIDEAISIWSRRYNHPIAYTWPSLVDHADLDTVVVHPDAETRQPGRVAWRAEGRPHWTSKAVAL